MKVPVVDSEFADVSVEVDTKASRPRLRLGDRRTGRVRFLDALDPSADRWRDA
jgi:hypothetical protein